MNIKNTCFIGAMSVELLALDELLGESETSYVSFDKEIVSDENVAYFASPKLGNCSFNAYDIRSNEEVVVKNEYDNNVTVFNTQVGLYNANKAANLVEKERYYAIVNIGTAGAISEDLKLGDVVMADSVYCGFENKLYGKHLNVFNSDDIKKAGVFSSFQFLDNKYKNLLKKDLENLNLNVKLCDMELYALAEVIPEIISIKIVSDELNHSSDEFINSFRSFIENYYNPKIKKLFY